MKKILLLWIISIVFPYNNPAFSDPVFQNTPEDSLRLLIVYPNEVDTINAAKIRISGSTNPEASVKIGSENMKVYASGAFAARFELEPGYNDIRITAEQGNKKQEKILKVYRVPPLESFPAHPTRFDPLLVEPSVDIAVLPGDELILQCKGSPGGTMVLNAGDLGKNIRMREKRKRGRNAVQGIYETRIVVPDYKKPKLIHPRYELKGKDGKKKKIYPDGKIILLDPDTPIIAETVNSYNYLFTDLDGTVYTSLPEGVKLNVTGKYGNMYRVLLAEGRTVYIDSVRMKILPEEITVPEAGVGGILCQNSGKWIRMSMSISEYVPYKVEQSINPQNLVLTIYGAKQKSQWITYPGDNSIIKRISINQKTENIVTVSVDLDVKQQWGYYAGYENGKMLLDIRKPPEINTGNGTVFTGLHFVLDAGHGGEELGAVGGTGLMEKDINLDYAFRLKSLLEAAGAEVTLTRDEDVTMPLVDRNIIAKESDGDIFVWLHNNSIGGASNPITVRGTSTYFTIPQSKGLADHVYRRLLKTGLWPFGRVSSFYFITSQTFMPTFLVEGAFLSNPEDEMLLMDSDFIDKIVKAIFDGMEDFLKSQQ